MKGLNVLLVTYSFPPIGGTGVMRAASLARYLPSEHIRLDVLTARNPSAVGNDPTLLKDIPAAVTVHRTLTLDLPFGIKKRLKGILVKREHAAVAATGSKSSGNSSRLKTAVQNLLQPDPQVTWTPILRRAARRIIKRRGIDLVIITVPPFSSLLLAEKIREEFPDLAIVLDFRDEWIQTSFELVSFLFTSSERNRKRAEEIEAKAIRSATAVVAVTEAARGVIASRYSGEPKGKFCLIPNGFDSTRLQKIASRHHAALPGGRTVVTHVGTIYASTAPSGFVQAAQSLPDEVKHRLQLRFIGHIEEPHFREMLLRLGEMVEMKGYLPQAEALAAMNETDYVLLINHDPLNVGGKFYDYIGGGKPILGALHPAGETCALMQHLRAGWWASNHDVEGIRQLLIDAVERGGRLDKEFLPDTAKIAHYERKVLAQKYAALLHSIAEGKATRGSDSQDLHLHGTVRD